MAFGMGCSCWVVGLLGGQILYVEGAVELRTESELDFSNTGDRPASKNINVDKIKQRPNVP